MFLVPLSFISTATKLSESDCQNHWTTIDRRTFEATGPHNGIGGLRVPLMIPFGGGGGKGVGTAVTYLMGA